MPKMKTLKTASKRFKRTASGKFKRFHAFATHLMTGKSSNKKRKLRKGVMVHKSDATRLVRLMPYK